KRERGHGGIVEARPAARAQALTGKQYDVGIHEAYRFEPAGGTHSHEGLKSVTRQSLRGPFAATKLNSGVWQLTAEVTDGARVYLHGAAPEASKLLAGMRITALEFEWRMR